MSDINRKVIAAHSAGGAPQVGAAQLRLLERLCNACAVSGDEGEVRAIVLEEVRKLGLEPKVDALGNVLVTRQGSAEKRMRVMIAAHMDEVGFMLVHEDGEGLYRFEIVGGIDPRQMVGKPVWIGKTHIPGVIGARPIHLTSPDERRHAPNVDSLCIDLGPQNGKKVKVGDRGTFATKFTRLGPSLRAKALDDRFGVAALIELLRTAPPNIDLLAAFTVQEEVGLRGARVAAYTFDPDLAFVLDCTPANDLPAWDDGGFTSGDRPENFRYNTRLGGGPAIYTADNATLSDPRLVRYLMATGEAAGIPFQLRQPGGGGTDAGAIHKARTGIPSVSVSVPGRYMHTAAGLSRLDDWKNLLALVHAALVRLSPDIFNEER